MSASAWVLDKVQRALVAHLQGKEFTWIDSANIVAGIHRPAQVDEDIEREVHAVPVIICRCESAQAVALHSGEWDATAVVRMECGADDYTADEFHAMAIAVSNAICTDEIAADLTDALDDFTALKVNSQSVGWTIEGRRWAAEITLQIFCCGSDIAAS